MEKQGNVETHDCFDADAQASDLMMMEGFWDQMFSLDVNTFSCLVYFCVPPNLSSLSCKADLNSGLFNIYSSFPRHVCASNSSGVGRINSCITTLLLSTVKLQRLVINY